MTVTLNHNSNDIQIHWVLLSLDLLQSNVFVPETRGKKIVWTNQDTAYSLTLVQTAHAYDAPRFFFPSPFQLSSVQQELFIITAVHLPLLRST